MTSRIRQTAEAARICSLAVIVAGLMAPILFIPSIADAQGNILQRRYREIQESEGQGSPSAVIARNGVPTQQRLRGAYLEGGELYLRLYDLGVYLGAQDRIDIKNKYELIMGNGRYLKFTVSSPVVIIDNQSSRAVNLPRPVKLHEGALYAPASGIASLLSEFTGRQCDYVPENGWLNFGGTGLNVLGIRMTHRQNQGTEVEIQWTESLQYEPFTDGEGWLHITLEGARADIAALKRTRCVGLVTRLEVIEQRDDLLQISFRLSRRYRETPEFIPVGGGLLFVLRNSVAGERIEESGARAPVARRGGIQTVVIDPGHGGKDPGSEGPTGLKEKDVVLDIALRLRELLRKDPRTENIKVIMTRESDVFIPLGDRTKIANQEKGDLFISIHCNGLDNPSANGFMTFFLDEAKNDESRQIAMFENSVVKYEESSRAMQIDAGEPMLMGILGELISTKYLEESLVLAGLVQDELIGRIRHQVQPRRLDQAGFLVLNGASMPSVLVEVAFITNRAEENFLRQNSFKNKVAEALHAAIWAYKERVETGR